MVHRTPGIDGRGERGARSGLRDPPPLRFALFPRAGAHGLPGLGRAETVTFTLTCSDGCAATARRYVCFTVGTSGCIEANRG